MQFLQNNALPYRGDDCILWPYTKDQKGYPQMYYEGRVARVGRIICTITHGQPLHPKDEASHSCGNGHLGCVNPQHLSWKSHAENIRDKFGHGTVLRGECIPSSKLTADQVRGTRALKGILLQRQIAEMFNTSQANISRILSNAGWSHLE